MDFLNANKIVLRVLKFTCNFCSSTSCCYSDMAPIKAEQKTLSSRACNLETKVAQKYARAGQKNGCVQNWYIPESSHYI